MEVQLHSLCNIVLPHEPRLLQTQAVDLVITPLDVHDFSFESPQLVLPIATLQHLTFFSKLSFQSPMLETETPLPSSMNSILLADGSCTFSLPTLIM